MWWIHWWKYNHNNSQKTTWSSSSFTKTAQQTVWHVVKHIYSSLHLLIIWFAVFNSLRSAKVWPCLAVIKSTDILILFLATSLLGIKLTTSQYYFWYWAPNIYIIITKNIRYFLWNRRFWRSLNNTYPIFLTPCIRCTNHLCDSFDLTDVNPPFSLSRLQMIQNVDLLWRHRYKSRSPAIVTSQWPIVPAWLVWTLS